jgi:hypothetical protein
VGFVELQFEVESAWIFWRKRIPLDPARRSPALCARSEGVQIAIRNCILQRVSTAASAPGKREYHQYWRAVSRAKAIHLDEFVTFVALLPAALEPGGSSILSFSRFGAFFSACFAVTFSSTGGLEQWLACDRRLRPKRSKRERNPSYGAVRYVRQ